MHEELTEKDYEIAASNGISKTLAKQRFYNQGFEKERAITEPPRKRRKQSWYRIYKDECERRGIGEKAFNSRLKRGMHPKVAATTPLNIHRTEGRKPNPNAKLNREHYARALENGISRGTLQGRVYQRKWPVEEAIKAPLGTRRKSL